MYRSGSNDDMFLAANPMSFQLYVLCSSQISNIGQKREQTLSVLKAKNGGSQVFGTMTHVIKAMQCRDHHLQTKHMQTMLHRYYYFEVLETG